MTESKPTFDNLAERVRFLEARHHSDLGQIEAYRKIGNESKHSLQGYESLARYSRDIILFIRRKDRRIIDFNDAALKAYGYARDELLSLEIHDLRSPETTPLSPPQVYEADLSGILFETIHRRKDGTSFPVEVSSTGAEINGERCILSIVRDITERKRVEQALKESTEYLHQLINHIGDPVFVIDRQHRFVLVNEAMCAFTRSKREDLLGRSVRELGLPKEEADFIWEQENLIFENGQNSAAEEKATDAQGNRHTVITKKTLLMDNAGRMQIVGIISDVTTRKRAEEALRASELRYRSLFETADDGIFLLDQTGFVDCNEAGARMYGLAKEKVIGRSPADFSPEHQPDGRPSAETIKGTIAEVMAGKRQKLEWVSRRSDGTLFDVELTLCRMDEMESPYLLAMVREITERKKADQALKKSQECLAEAQRQTHIGSFEFDFQAGRLDWSQEMFNICGVRQEDFQGIIQDFLDRIHPEDLQQVDKRREEGLNKAGPLDLDFRIMRPNGEIRFVRMIFETAFDEDGNPLRRIGTFQDITEHKRAEEEQTKLIAQLQQAQKMESVGRLAGGVAHDFNNMLGVILGHAEMALEQVDPANPLYNDLLQIQKAGQRSADLTRQLLAFARRQTVMPRVLDLNETIAGMLKMLQRMIGENINLNWQPAATVWPVRIDPSQIDQILANLCVNARDAIADVGRITIETENCTLDKDYCSAHEGCVPGKYVRLAVSDNGCGMEKEILRHVFEPFFTTKEVGQGTGLGLATVYGAIKQNNGYINVESELGAGTTIAIYLPRHMENSERTQMQEAGETRQGKETVLLVEDEIAILRLTTTILQKQGYSVLSASTPGEAIRLAREHQGEMHLLMTDVIMPEMNGRTLAKNLQYLYPRMKCLFMSGYTADIVAHHGVLDEGVCFIQKPFSARDLANKLIEVLGSE
jgi:two-component system, cell cycle sensor histidine kinase and response regulator CckA